MSILQANKRPRQATKTNFPINKLSHAKPVNSYVTVKSRRVEAAFENLANQIFDALLPASSPPRCPMDRQQSTTCTEHSRSLCSSYTPPLRCTSCSCLVRRSWSRPAVLIPDTCRKRPAQRRGVVESMSSFLHGIILALLKRNCDESTFSLRRPRLQSLSDEQCLVSHIAGTIEARGDLLP